MAWERLTEREPEPYVQARRAPSDSRYAYRMHLTEAGRAHYRQRWADYVRCYPDVDAPHPDGVPLWPEQVDQALAALRARCQQLRGYLTEANVGLEQLSALPGLVPALEVPFAEKGEAEPPPSVKASVARRDRAAQNCRRAIDKAAVRFTTALEQAAAAYREALTAHQAEVEEPYRDACLHYVLAAAAAAAGAAVADGRDPVTAVNAADPAAITVWPWLPEVPVTGLTDVDASLENARLRAGPGVTHVSSA